MDREGENEEKMRKCREWISLHFLLLSPFPHSLTISSSFSHYLSILLQPGCQEATICATLVYANRLFSKIKTTSLYSRGCAAYNCIGKIKLLHFPLSVFLSSNKKERHVHCSLWTSGFVCWNFLNVCNVVFSLLTCGCWFHTTSLC